MGNDIDEGEGWRPQVRQDLSVADLDGELVIYNPVTYAVHHLDRVGSLMWPFLDGSATLDELATDVADAFSVPVDVASADLTTLLEDLRHRRLVAGDEPEPRGDVRDADAAEHPSYLSDPPAP